MSRCEATMERKRKRCGREMDHGGPHTYYHDQGGETSWPDHLSDPVTGQQDRERATVECVPASEIVKGDEVLVTGKLGVVRKTVFSTLSSEEDGCALTFTDADSWWMPSCSYDVARVLPQQGLTPLEARGLRMAAIFGTPDPVPDEIASAIKKLKAIEGTNET